MKSPRQEHPKEPWLLEAAGTVYPTCRQDKENGTLKCSWGVAITVLYGKCQQHILPKL